MATSIEEVAMNVRYRVESGEVERGELRAMLSGGKRAARKLKRAQILLAAHAPGAARELTGKEEALLVATACASPPEGRARWTLELLAGEMVRLTAHASLSRETVRRRLAENALKPWRQRMWCIPRVNGEFVARMEDVLDLYAEAPDPKRPVVCFDESPTQLLGEVRRRIPPEPGQVERFDYEHRRAGTVNLFVLVDAHRPWRKVTVTQQRTALAFARCMRELVEVDHPQAERVRVVLDNLSTHTPGALYEAFPAEEAHRLLRRLEFHFTPKHASWLNMAEIEIGVLKRQCLSRRIADRERLEREIAAWQRGRNAAEAKIEWMFTTEAARTKLGRFYPHPPQGERTRSAGDQRGHERVIPAGVLALALQARLQRAVRPGQVQRDLAQERQVPGRVALAHPARVLAEDDVEHPVQPVPHPPMAPYGGREPFRGEPRA